MAGNVFSSIALPSSSGGSATLCAFALRYGSSYWAAQLLQYQTGEHAKNYLQNITIEWITHHVEERTFTRLSIL